MRDKEPDTSPKLPTTPLPEAGNTPPSSPAKPRRKSRPLANALTGLSLSITLSVLVSLALGIAALAGVGRLFTATGKNTNTPSGTFSVIKVQGVIGSSSGGTFGMGEPAYLHNPTVKYIRELAEDDGNHGILLYMNTPGGGVFQSDETYRALEYYKQKTSRPVWAYMHTTCASGGYYISMAADKLVANYNTTTGSIGVYIQLTDTSALYEKLGIESVLIRSGDNKGIGADGVHISEENRAVYQSIVDESYERFLSLVKQARSYPDKQAREICDGRPYTANQALQNGLIDELGDWESVLAAFKKETGAKAFTPSFSSRTPLGSLLSGLAQALPKTETEASLNAAEALPSGVLMAYAPGLGWPMPEQQSTE